jgi:putative effector of murein hydrolase LrgA (UPF0299 family)/RNA polymerase subunit RPABC4/transcription elongation factor Spt4
MNRFPEMKVIPTGGWIAAVLGSVCVAFWAIFIGGMNYPDFKPDPMATSVAIWLALFLFGYFLLIGYVNGDARRRGMRYVMWTMLAIFIPNGIGIILYFIMRDPLPQTCSSCGVVARTKGTFCPNCGTALTNVCKSCGRAVEPSWTHCTGCGTALK